MTVKQLLAYFMNQTRAAETIGVTQPAVGRWIRENKIPILRQHQIESLTNGALVAAKKKGRKNVQPANPD